MSSNRMYLGADFPILRREVDRLFESLLPTRSEQPAPAHWTPLADLVETEDGYIITMDVPGIDPEHIEVTFEDGQLKIAGERTFEKSESNKHFHRIERRFGSFSRTFRFGDNANPESVEAAFADGVLTINLAKREAIKPRKIEISRQVNGNVEAAEVTES